MIVVKPHYFNNYHFFRRLLILLICASLPASCSTRKIETLPTTEHVFFRNENALDVNSATADELERLPGIGRGLARRIVEHRERYGPFRRAEHLILVRGMSDGRFRQIREMVRVE